MNFNIADRVYIIIMGLFVSYASVMYATYGTRAFAMYFILCVVMSSVLTFWLHYSRITQTLFKNAREINKHPDLRDDLDLF